MLVYQRVCHWYWDKSWIQSFGSIPCIGNHCTSMWESWIIPIALGNSFPKLFYPFFIFFAMEWWFNFDLICWYSMSIVSAILLLVSIWMSIVIDLKEINSNDFHYLSLTISFPYFKQHNTCYMYIYTRLIHLSTIFILYRDKFGLVY